MAKMSDIAYAYERADQYGFESMVNMLAKAGSKPLKECEQGQECHCEKCDAAAEKKKTATLQ